MCLLYVYILLLRILQDVVELEDGKEVVSPPLLQLSAEKVSRYGIFLMEYGLVGCGQRGLSVITIYTT